MAFAWLKGTGMPLVNCALVIGLSSVALAALAAWHLKETFGRDLDYMEQ